MFQVTRERKCRTALKDSSTKVFWVAYRIDSRRLGAVIHSVIKSTEACLAVIASSLASSDKFPTSPRLEPFSAIAARKICAECSAHSRLRRSKDASSKRSPF